MADLLRQEIAAAAPMVVVKVGTRVLTLPDGTLNNERIGALAEELVALIEGGRKVALVTSGAVGAGMSQLGLTKRPHDLAQLQAVAAIGQAKLIEAYDRHFRKHKRNAAQLLLTAGDFDDRKRHLNVRNTVLALMQMGAVPVINENDTVAVDELMATFGDNDKLAAILTTVLRAPLLVILSDVAGLYDGDPAIPGHQVIPTVTKLDDSIFALVRDKLTGLSKGGMASKLNAARIVTTAGENLIIASGREPGMLARIFAGEPVGTLFTAQGKAITPWKRWLGFSTQPRGKIVVDAGARGAIVEKGRSLLSVGVEGAEGEFEKGDVVSLIGPDGREFARGLSNYAAADVQKIKKLRTAQLAEVLGREPYEEVIHRDNMVVVS